MAVDSISYYCVVLDVEVSLDLLDPRSPPFDSIELNQFKHFLTTRITETV